jgi:RNA polymerase sigma-70 factor (ECF subfamily)
MKKSYQDLTDEILMQTYQDGDVMAFEVLYARHSKKVFFYLCKRVDRETASDLMQETFLKLHKSKELYDPQFPFLPWLFTVTKNTCMDGLRKKMRNKETAPLDENLTELMATPMIQDSSDLSSAMVNALPPDQGRAVALRYLEDWSFEDIAKKLNTTSGNSRQLVSRGVQKLKQILSSKGDTHEKE